jgi:hypothetical protein
MLLKSVSGQIPCHSYLVFTLLYLHEAYSSETSWGLFEVIAMPAGGYPAQELCGLVLELLRHCSLDIFI